MNITQTLINTEVNVRLEPFRKSALNIFQPVDLKSPESIAGNMKVQGLQQGLAGAGIGALGGALGGAVTGRNHKRRAAIGALLGALGGGGYGAFRGADQAFRGGLGENADILNQTADNETVAGVPIDPAGVAGMRRQAREMQDTSLLKALVQ